MVDKNMRGMHRPLLPVRFTQVYVTRRGAIRTLFRLTVTPATLLVPYPWLLVEVLAKHDLPYLVLGTWFVFLSGRLTL